jgi:hypothetical protein
MMSSQFAELVSRNRPAIPMPALFTRMSTTPCSLKTCAARSSIADSSLTSAWYTAASAHAARTASALSLAAARSRSMITTLRAPCRASSTAVALPMPAPAPVTSASLPCTWRGPPRITGALSGAAPPTLRSTHSPVSRAMTSGREVTTQCPPSIEITRPPAGIAPVNRCRAGVTKRSRRGTSTCTATVVFGSCGPGAKNGSGMFSRYRLSPLR